MRDVCISINKYKTARFASPRPIGARGHTQTHSLYCICISISKHKYRMERNTNLRSLFHHGDHVVVRGAAPMSGPRDHAGALESTLLNLQTRILEACTNDRKWKKRFTQSLPLDLPPLHCIDIIINQNKIMCLLGHNSFIHRTSNYFEGAPSNVDLR